MVIVMGRRKRIAMRGRVVVMRRIVMFMRRGW
jgi:hypothetical protein